MFAWPSRAATIDDTRFGNDVPAAPTVMPTTAAETPINAPMRSRATTMP